MATRQEKEANARFSHRYGEASGDVARSIERDVIGGDWGANGYTTTAQADQLADVLNLGAGSMVLDLGAGRGWPGLYLCSRTGCSVVMTDLPVEGLVCANERAQQEGLDQRAWPVNASARDLPFSAETFDAVVHTDVLC
ncbi:MAG TPA: class I SAM-dependent methyltransferase [Ilumatobacteraceae bacterium]|jgi:2-polyprenyl-3-methyl-5-hydroxy-6-metoxy-1,4-benzoquinol methylase|nr:class I SAM-dependent methyltransferase [Ilumatobacteraceae bacterium]